MPEGLKKKPGRAGKDTSFFDFITAPEINIPQLFAKSTTSIVLAKDSLVSERNRDKSVLPTDYNISSKSMLQLFTKPSWQVRVLARVHETGGTCVRAHTRTYSMLPAGHGAPCHGHWPLHRVSVCACVSVPGHGAM